MQTPQQAPDGTSSHRLQFQKYRSEAARRGYADRDGGDHCGRRGRADQAVEDGMLTLRMDGLMKISRGVTTLEEVIKETAA